MAFWAVAAQVLPVLLLVLAVEFRAFAILRSQGELRFAHVVFYLSVAAEFIALLKLGFDYEAIWTGPVTYAAKLVVIAAIAVLLGLIGSLILPRDRALEGLADRGD